MKLNAVQFAEALISKHSKEGALEIASTSFRNSKLLLTHSYLPNYKDLGRHRIRNSAELDRLMAEEHAVATKTVNFWDHVYGIIWKKNNPNEKRSAQ